MEIQDIVCNYFQIPKERLSEKTRKREVVVARQVSHFFYKEETKLSLAAIGEKVGGKDHATVLHSCKTVNNLIDTDPRFRKHIETLGKLIENGLASQTKINNNQRVWIKEGEKSIQVKVIDFSPESNHWKLIYEAGGVEAGFYYRKESEIYFIKPENAYRIVFAESVDDLLFDYQKITHPNHILVLGWNIDNLEKTVRFVSKCGLRLLDINGLVWDNKVIAQPYLIAFKSYHLTDNPVKKVRNTVISSSKSSLFGRLKQLSKGKVAILSNKEDYSYTGCDLVEYDGLMINVKSYGTT